MSFDKKTVEDIDVLNKTVLVRVDYNVPQDKATGEVTDSLRIEESLVTINNLLDRGAKVVLAAHLGRPDGVRNEKYSLRPVFDKLVEMLPDEQVGFVDNDIEVETDEIRGRINRALGRSVVLLENIRFHASEELKGKTDEDKAKKLEFAQKIIDATGAEVFVLDGFGVAHRDNTSVSTVSELIPGVAGFLLEKEVTTIESAMENPERPFVAVIGGAKISDKIGVIKAFIEKADKIVIGGAMANTFLKYNGLRVGRSLIEEGQEEVIREIYDLAEKTGVELILPTDVVVAPELSEDAEAVEKNVSEVGENDRILDIGSGASSRATEALSDAKTIIWNGTVGCTEIEKFAGGSVRILEAISENKDTVSIVGGGDTAGFVKNYQKDHSGVFVTHISTGGGAGLELMEGINLPGVAALQDK